MAALTTPPGQTTYITNSAVYDRLVAGSSSSVSVSGTGVVLTILGPTSLEGTSSTISGTGYAGLEIGSGAAANLKGDVTNTGISLSDGAILTLGGADASGLTVSTNDTVILSNNSSVTVTGFGTGDEIKFRSPVVSFTAGGGPGTFPYHTGVIRPAGTLSVVEQDGSTDIVNFNSTGQIYYTSNFQIVNGAVAYYTPQPLTIAGNATTQTIAENQSINPLAGIIVADQNTGQTDVATIQVLTNIGSLVDPNAAADGSTYNASTGAYTVAGSATAVSQALSGLVFSPNDYTLQPGHTLTASFGLVVSDSVTSASSSTTVTVMPPAYLTAPTTKTVTAAENSPAVALNIAAPVSGNRDPSSLTITAGALPTDGIITLADGVSDVSAGQSLTNAQLTGLMFKPTYDLSSASSAFNYTVADAAGNASNGSVVLAIGPQSPPISLSLAATSDSGTVGDNITDVAMPTITGFAAAGSAINLYDGTTLIGTGATNASGAWSVTASSPLTPGNNSLTATATDIAGTVSSPSTPLAVTFDTTPITPSSIGQPVFRFYNPNNEAHFFTSSPAEVAQIQATRPDMTLEGTAFNAVDPATDTAAVSVYRFYNASNDSHFYTDSMAEVQQVVATRPDMTLEGPAFSVDPTMQAGDVPVYRFYETRSDTHLYTSNPAEVGTIQATRPDLTLEGPAFFIKA